MNTIDLRNINILNTGTVDPQSSGLSVILDIFNECAKRDGVAGIIDNVFIEYSTISSMLVDSKMLGYACLGEGADVMFGVNVVRYAEPIIKHVQDNKISLYHHKDFISAKKSESFHKAGHKFISSVCFGNNNKKKEVIEKYSIDSINVKGNEISQKKKYWAISYNIKYKDFISLIDEYPKERNSENLEDFFAVIHILYDKYFWPNNLPKDTNSVFFGIPTIGAIVKGNNISGQGGVFVYFTYSCNDNKIKEFIDNISVELDYAVKSITLNVLANAGLVLAQKVSKESIKSAKAAIMSRNMSHNLGSHVMFYIKQKLESVSKIVQGGVLRNIISGDSSNNNLPGDIVSIQEILKNIEKNESVELPFLVGLGRFINYLQERQDYIATIATDYIPARSTISFKDFVYDELKPDLRYERHHKSSNPDVSGSEPGNLLLDYIAFSEGYTPSDSIELKFGEFTGKSIEKHETELDKKAEEDFERLRKFNIAAPGGVIARQAIFSIVENIIRNAAKHSDRRQDGKLSIVFELLDKTGVLSSRLKNDQCELRCKRSEASAIESGESLIAKYEEYINDYHILSIKLDMPNDKGQIDRLVDKLGEDYIGSDGAMKDSAKGLKEMRISAAWLRGHSIDTEVNLQEPPILSVLSEPIEGSDKYTLTYLLCIPKPRKIAFVVDDTQTQHEKLNVKILNVKIKPYGCEVFNASEIISSNCKIPNYDLVCLCTDKNREFIISKISSRYIGNTVSALKQLDELSKTDEVGKKIDSIYAVWFDEWHKKSFPESEGLATKNHPLVILDAKARDNQKNAEGKFKDEYGVFKKGLVVTMSTGDAQLDDCDNRVVYSTHYKGLKGNTDLAKLKNAVCIESVTGNNSTDRLIRKDDWTQEWACKHLFAGLSKVAIFDERIFSTFIQSSGLGENTIDTCLDEYYNRLENERKSSDLIRLIENLLGIVYNEARKIVNATKKSRDSLKKEIMRRALRNYNVDVAQINHERRIWAYDIRCIKDNNNPRVDIVGYTAPILGTVGAYISQNTLDERLASVTKQGDNYVVEIINSQVFNEKQSQVFDYISIHQGILDKIYTTFDIKAQPDEMFKITNALHKTFSKHPTPTEYKKTLPNFIIHSGRSKPSLDDMPQPQPFVQFAAIDQGVKDCKYTLVELLATAHYEDGNNH